MPGAADRPSGREVVARCPTRDDVEQAADWLEDRLSRFASDLRTKTAIQPGGGQFLLALITA